MVSYDVKWDADHPLSLLGWGTLVHSFQFWDLDLDHWSSLSRWTYPAQVLNVGSDAQGLQGLNSWADPRLDLHPHSIVRLDTAGQCVPWAAT